MIQILDKYKVQAPGNSRDRKNKKIPKILKNNNPSNKMLIDSSIYGIGQMIESFFNLRGLIKKSRHS